MKMTAIFEKLSDGYLAFLEEFPGASAQGATLEEARENLCVAVELVIYSNRLLSEELVQGRPVLREPFQPAE